MSQRNPMNERYQNDERVGKTRKSAASAKPKKEAAGTVVMKTSRKTPKERKAEQKEARRKEQERQRELDRKYYKPDTERFKKLKRWWWVSLIGAVICLILSWAGRSFLPEGVALGILMVAYVLIIVAFYLDFSKIRKERRAYQEKMIALEAKQEKEERHNKATKGGNKASNKGGSKTDDKADSTSDAEADDKTDNKSK